MLMSWLLIFVLVTLYGRLITRIATVQTGIAPDHLWRTSLWWGLTLMVIMTLALGSLVPLGSPSAALAILGIGGLLGVASAAVLRPKRPRWKRPPKSIIFWLGAAWLSIAYLAFKALGPVTNYDSGLYHLGAVKYAAEYAAIPGIANLYFPFGYANAQFPLAALLGNGPWDGIGYRLINGAVLVLVLIDLTSRLLNRRWTWGSFTLLFGLSAAFIPMVALADDMVTSPTADTSVMLLTLVAAAYLADALQARAPTFVDAVTAIMLAGLAVAFRPTMVVFALSVLVVAATLAWRRRRKSARVAAPWIMATTVLFLLAMVSLLRDRVLSGWIFYPLSNFPVPVPWIAQNPEPWRDGTLAAARDPSTKDGFQTAHSYDWIAGWFARLPYQWESWFLLVGLLITTTVLVIAWRSHVMRGAWTSLLAVLAPSSLSLLVWFFLSPPSFRFIWGPALAFLALPLGIGTARLFSAQLPILRKDAVRGVAFIASGVCIATVTAFSAVERNQFATINQERTWRLGSLAIDYATTPVPRPTVASVDLGNGLTIQTPIEGDQCWDNYPLCVFYTGQLIEPRGPSIQDGFNDG